MVIRRLFSKKNKQEERSIRMSEQGEDIFFDFDSSDKQLKQDPKMAAGENVTLTSVVTSNISLISDMKPFSGDDETYSSIKWAEDVEDNAEISGWSENQKLLVARRSLVGKAKLWLQYEKTFKKYDDLKTALIKEFSDSINTKELHELMSNRKKRKDESYYQYMLVMKELGRRAKLADYVAVQYIIDGIPDYEPNKSILYGANTDDEFRRQTTELFKK